MPGLREPRWWYAPEPAWQALLLSPVSNLVGWVAARRLRQSQSYCSRLPVICIGNFTVGGSGKTPLALLIAGLVSDAGRTPWFLSRGYGGKLSGPVRVDVARHTAADVGDEPLLLATRASAVVSRDRPQGAKLIEAEAGPNGVIIMDDGLQNPSLAKDLAIVAVDRERGFGNRQVMPSGPLRAPLKSQIALANLIVLTGQDGTTNKASQIALLKESSLPIISATTRASTEPDHWRGRRVLAYAGIANPNRFFDMLAGLGADLVERRAFGDHHPFSDRDARDLMDAARVTSSTLVTTQKDLVRMTGRSSLLAELKNRSEALAIRSVITDADLDILRALIAKTIALFPLPLGRGSG